VRTLENIIDHENICSYELGNDIYTSCAQQLHSHKTHWDEAHTLDPTPMCLV
jgi:hypothetical protein